MRRNKPSLKSTHLEHYFGDNQLLPMWLCDIDIPYSEDLKEKISFQTQSVSLSYSGVSNSYFEDLKMWFMSEHALDVSACSLRITPSVITSIAVCIDAFAGDKHHVGVFSPCYSGVLDIIRHKKKIPLCVPIDMKKRGGIRFDVSVLENTLKYCRIFILCNPHNPTGIVWTHEELKTIADLASKSLTLVITDEVLGDYTYHRRYIPYVDVCSIAKENSVFLQSFSKTFNCGGLMTANTLFFNNELKDKFELAMDQCGLWLANPLSIEIIKCLIRNSKEWRTMVRKSILESIQAVHCSLEKDIPYISSYIPESGLSMWLEFQKPISDPALFLQERCKIAALPGNRFGCDFRNYARISIGGAGDIFKEFIKRIRKNRIDL